jgi:hypothetical protein
MWSPFDRKVRCMTFNAAGRNQVKRIVCTPFAINNTKPGTLIITDTSRVYNTAAIQLSGRAHLTVNHLHKQWVCHITNTGGIRQGTNAIEARWSSLQAMLREWKAQSITDMRTLDRYVAEFEWRVNNKCSSINPQHNCHNPMVQFWRTVRELTQDRARAQGVMD